MISGNHEIISFKRLHRFMCLARHARFTGAVEPRRDPHQRDGPRAAARWWLERSIAAFALRPFMQIAAFEAGRRQCRTFLQSSEVAARTAQSFGTGLRCHSRRCRHVPKPQGTILYTDPICVIGAVADHDVARKTDGRERHGYMAERYGGQAVGRHPVSRARVTRSYRRETCPTSRP